MNTEHVGPPVACNLVKLADVPEMEYYVSSNQGEICVKGSNVFQGYFKDPNSVSFDDHGWHHTGDIGMWLPVSRKRYLIRDVLYGKRGSGYLLRSNFSQYHNIDLGLQSIDLIYSLFYIHR